jgi:AcrR family transcriptional regulator
VLRAAGEVFAERGLDATLADIAERAGVGVGTIYRRFPDKEALIAALLETKLSSLREVIDEAAQKETGWDAFVSLLEELVRLVSADRALQEIMLSDYGAERAVHAVAILRPYASEIVDRAKREGALRADFKTNDLPPLLSMLISVTDYIGPGRPEAWRRYLQLLLDGLGPGPRPPRLPEPALSDAELDAATRTQRTRRRPVGP